METRLEFFVGFIDTMMVSSIGEAAVSGVFLVDSIIMLFIIIIFLFYLLYYPYFYYIIYYIMFLCSETDFKQLILLMH